MFYKYFSKNRSTTKKRLSAAFFVCQCNNILPNICIGARSVKRADLFRHPRKRFPIRKQRGHQCGKLLDIFLLQQHRSAFVSKLSCVFVLMIPRYIGGRYQHSGRAKSGELAQAHCPRTADHQIRRGHIARHLRNKRHQRKMRAVLQPPFAKSGVHPFKFPLPRSMKMKNIRQLSLFLHQRKHRLIERTCAKAAPKGKQKSACAAGQCDRRGHAVSAWQRISHRQHACCHRQMRATAVKIKPYAIQPPRQHANGKPRGGIGLVYCCGNAQFDRRSQRGIASISARTDHDIGRKIPQQRCCMLRCPSCPKNGFESRGADLAGDPFYLQQTDVIPRTTGQKRRLECTISL